MPVAVKQRRTRVTKKDIELARKQLAKQTKPTKRKTDPKPPRYGKDPWYGLVYCDSNGYASIVGDDLEGIWLGRTDEVIPYLKSRGIDGEDAGVVIQAVKQLRVKPKPIPPIDYERPPFFGVDGYLPLPPYRPAKANDGKPPESESQSYHLATKNRQASRVRGRPKSHRIILKKDPHFLASLDELISKGYGIPTIQKKLKAKGYEVAYATLGRWAKNRRDATRS